MCIRDRPNVDFLILQISAYMQCGIDTCTLLHWLLPLCNGSHVQCTLWFTRQGGEEEIKLFAHQL